MDSSSQAIPAGTKVEHYEVSDSTTTTEEDMSEEELPPRKPEGVIREETQKWLAMHGPKLYALEASKHFAIQERKRNLRTIK